jgi:hypothetical protein
MRQKDEKRDQYEEIRSKNIRKVEEETAENRGNRK